MTNNDPASNRTILGIDPGSKRMGVAVLRNGLLAAYAVHTLRNGSHARDVVDQARSIMLSLIEEFSPSIVAIEQPLLFASKRAALVTVIGEELMARARERRVRVVEIAPREVRRILVDDERATKVDVARRIVDSGFPELRVHLPIPPKRAALGLRPRDRYWLHAFDALAVALAVERRVIHSEQHTSDIRIPTRQPPASLP